MWVTNIDDPIASFGNTCFEINEVDYADPSWALGKRYTYKITCAAYTFSWEKLASGIKALDTIQDMGNGDVENQDPTQINTSVPGEASGLVQTDTNNPFGNF